MLTPDVLIKAQLEQCHVLRKNAVLAQSSFGPTEIEGALSQLSQAGECVLKNEFVFRPDAWKKLCDQAQTLIAAHHQAHPEQAGLPLAELKSSLGSRLVCPGVFDTLTADLERSGFVRTGSAISRMNHRPALPARLQAVADSIHRAVGVQSLDPPSRKTLGQDRLGQEALAFLIRAGDLVELSPEIVLSRKAFLQAMETIRLFLRQHGTATVSELRQALGASRRVVVPLLEKLDRTGVTQREGDKRHLKRSA
jgi:selenocysteine-specific elongation factor